MEQVLSFSRAFISIAFLAYASWSDFRTREVSNTVWVLYAPTAFVLTLTQLLFFGLDRPFFFGLSQPLDSLAFYGLSFAIVLAFSVALFYAGAFGGADAKALMCLALSLPTLPKTIEPQSNFTSPFFPITVFSNAVLLAALTIVYALVRNAFWKLRTGSKLFAGLENESAWRKILALMTGYKVELRTLEKKNAHVYLLEDIATKETGEDERRLLVFPKDETQETIVARILSAGREENLKNGVWVTPGLPLLIFITAGLIIALLFGDIVWLFLRFILLPR